MWLMPSSTTLRSTAMAASSSSGGPNTPGPASCIAPKPIRVTSSVLPNFQVPAAVTFSLLMGPVHQSGGAAAPWWQQPATRRTGGEWMVMSTLTAAPRPGDGQVITLRGEAELFARAGHLFEAREEFVCAAMDMRTWSRRDAQHVKAAQIAANLASGLQMRKLYNP